jgi:ppGpp synthetase/RelA/SpoT-type nucleotidyltranferase
MTLRDDYQVRHDAVLTELAASLTKELQGYLAGQVRVDRIQARAKGTDRFVAKAEKINADGSKKYTHPLNQIQDQIGARIIVFYLSDVEKISKIIEEYFRPVEVRRLVPESEWQFGYFGKHYVLLFPAELIKDEWDSDKVPQFFELQIKTMFQHAWSEANHDLGYKPGARELAVEDVRSLAFASAQAWGADRMFDDLFRKGEAVAV